MPGNRSIDGIQRPARPKIKQDLRPDHDLPAPEPTPLLEESYDHGDDKNLGITKPPKKWKKWLLAAGGLMIVLLIAAFVAAYSWYQQLLQPASDDTAKYVRVVIKSGSTPGVIANQLESQGVIRSSLAFTIYTKLTGTENKLQAGMYMLQPSLSTPAIVDQLVSGEQHTFKITFLPGDTLANNRQRLIDLGLFEVSEIDAALNKTYDRPLFATKPAGTDLEGYIYGETYHFDASATPESILSQAFDQFESVIEQENLVEKFKKRGLTLYEGITLASVIQKEVRGTEDSRKVAQVFFKRLRMDMPLGADATFVYAAKKDGQQPNVEYDSPYNTRKHKGLPPGPISAPGIDALRAVANPAPGDFLYFVSGDDGKNYFARTYEEHQENVQKYCRENCALF